ncbi:MAG: DUF1290 domain-containing protein [Clostridia bacterium]|nr:DUF1290 domain-containing protein [Clostridia bacterium]
MKLIKNNLVFILAIAGFAVGALTGWMTNIYVSDSVSYYAAAIILAVSDSVMGAIKNYISSTYRFKEFIIGIVVNIVAVIAFIFAGSKLGIDLYMAVEIVFGIKIFEKISKIRSFLLNKSQSCDKI